MKALATPALIRSVFDPLTLSDCLEVKISRARMRRLRSTSAFAFYNARVAAEVLKSPEAIFWGIRIGRSTGYGWCYVGRPARLWVGDMESMTSPPGYVFTAYLDDRNNLFEWRLELANERAPDLPIDYLSGRFGELKWRKTT